MNSGDIFLLEFRATDFAAKKQRPVLLLQQLPGRFGDWLVCMISSQQHQQIPNFDELIAEQDRDFSQSGLHRPSVIRIARVAVVETGLLSRRIGRISKSRLARIKKRLARWIAR